MADQTRDQYQGFLLPDPRLSTASALWAAESTFTQASARTGMPAAQGDYEMVLEGSGFQSENGRLHIQAVQGAGTGTDARSGSYAWRQTGDASTGWRGWEAPATVSSFEAVDWGTAVGRANPDIVTLQHPDYEGRVVAVAQSAASASIEADWRNPKTGAWTNVTVHDGSGAGTGLPAYLPCLVEVGRRLYCLFFCRGEASASTFYGIRVMVSSDGGASWSIARRFATIETDMVLTGATSTEYNIQKLRAAYKGGQVLVLAWLQKGVGSGNADCFRQWASAELGLRLELVETWDPSSNDSGDFDLTVAGDSFVVTYLRSDGEMYWSQLGSAYQPLTIQETLSDTAEPWSGAMVVTGATPTRITDSDITSCTADDGVVWVYIRYAGSGATKRHSVATIYSADGGSTFAVWGISPANFLRGSTSCWWNAEATDHYPVNLAATWQRGRAVLAHNFVADDNANDNSLLVAYLGGYSDLTLPPTREALVWRDRATYAVTGLPYEASDDTAAWTNAGGAAVAFSTAVTASGEQITTGDGAGTNDNRYYIRTDTTTGDVAFIGEVTCLSTATSISTALVGWLIRIDDGTQGFECSIRFSNSQIAIYDEVSASQKAAVTIGVVGPWDVRVGMYAAEDGSVRSLRVWWRASDTSEDRQWTFIGNYSLADDGGTVGTNRVMYGNYIAGGATTQIVSTWQRKPHYSFGSISSLNGRAGSVSFWHDWDAATDNPTNLSGRLFSPSWVYVDDSVYIRAVDGPAHEGEEWRVDAVSEYPISRIAPTESRSPRVRHRTNDDTAAVEIALAFDATLLGTDESHPGSPVWGLHLGGVNWCNGSIYGYTGGAWVLITAFNLAGDYSGLDFTREGASLVPASDTFHNFSHNELAGWDVDYVTVATVRRLKGNSAGRWASTGGAGPRARFHLDGAAAGDPASGSNLRLRPRSGTVLFHLAASQTYSGFKVVIDAQDTVEGYFETGVMMLGPVLIQGAPYGRGRTIDHIPGWDREEYQDGTSTMIARRPMAREVAVAWPDGVYINPWHSTTAEPDYRSTTDTSGVEGATYRSGWVYDLVSSMRALNGHPLVYLPYIPRSDGSADVIVLNRYWQQVYGHVDGSVDVTQQHGEEWNTEVLTVASLEIVEET